MTIKAELEAQILRLYHVEKWRCGTIAKQLRVHRQTVQRVLAYAGLPRHGPPPRPSMIEPYLQFIQQTLETFPTLTASRLPRRSVKFLRVWSLQTPPPDDRRLSH